MKTHLVDTVAISMRTMPNIRYIFEAIKLTACINLIDRPHNGHDASPFRPSSDSLLNWANICFFEIAVSWIGLQL